MAVDSQSVKASGNAAADTVGFDDNKKVKDRKRHIAVDTLGLLIVLGVSAASLADAPVGRQVFVDGGYNDKVVEQQLVCHPIGTPTGRQRNPLQYVGTATGADISAYTRATTLTAFPPGPLQALMPDPYPLPTSHLSLHVDPNATLPPAPSNSGDA